MKAHVGAHRGARTCTQQQEDSGAYYYGIELRSDTGEYAYSGWRQRGASENSVSVLNSGVMQENIHKVGVIQENMHTLGGDKGG